jgi:hypothetical protein
MMSSGCLKTGFSGQEGQQGTILNLPELTLFSSLMEVHLIDISVCVLRDGLIYVYIVK